MPYSVDKDLGGDNKENDDFMEKCVKRVMDSGKDKNSAIAICKAQMKKKSESSVDSETTYDELVGLKSRELHSKELAESFILSALDRFDFDMDHVKEEVYRNIKGR